MARYQPRHNFLQIEPEDDKKKRRVILVRSGLGLALVGGALVLAASFASSGGIKKVPAAATPGGSGHGTTTLTTRRTRGAGGTTSPGGGTSGRTTGTGAKGTQGSAPGTRPGQEGTPGASLPPTVNPAAATATAQDLVAPAGFGPLLRQAWVAARSGGSGLTLADVRSTAAGSVLYAGQPSIGTFWALSQFVPSPRLQLTAGTAKGTALLALFAQGAVFYEAPAGKWSYAGHYTPGRCPSEVPAPVLAVWGMCSSVGS